MFFCLLFTHQGSACVQMCRFVYKTKFADSRWNFNQDEFQTRFHYIFVKYVCKIVIFYYNLLSSDFMLNILAVNISLSPAAI